MKFREVKFRIADDLVLDADLVVATDGIFATKGMGKSHLAQVMAEEMLANGQVIVAIDPTDAWWGLRSSADGRNDGYPVVVIGGDHGDLKLEPAAAVQLAEAVVDERFSCVICTDGMSDMAETKFVREFLDTIYRKNRVPIHLFIDEADVFAPQKPFDVEDARCIRAMSHIVRRGRKKGIGSTLITQRPAELSASVRTMVEMLFVLGMSHNLDIDAVEKWMRLRKKKSGNNSAFVLQEEMIASLDSLQRGDAWVWSPRLGIHQRFRARAKRTFDSGATPRPGQKVKAPKKLAAVDLQRLGAAMAAAVQRQKDDDPTELRKQLAALRQEIALKSKIVHELPPRIDAQQIQRIERLTTRLTDRFAKAAEYLDKTRDRIAQDLQTIASEIVDLRREIRGQSDSVTVASPNVVVPSHPAVIVAPQPPEDLKPAHLRLLSAIAWWESVGVIPVDLAGVAFLAKTSTKSSAFDNNRSYLKARDYIQYPLAGQVCLTLKGRVVAPPPQTPPTNEALHGTIFSVLTPAVGRMLRVLIDAYPLEVALPDLARLAGTSATSSAFDNNRAWLHARNLTRYPRAGFACAASLLFPKPLQRKG